jgi:hypothetical protein
VKVKEGCIPSIEEVGIVKTWSVVSESEIVAEDSSARIDGIRPTNLSLAGHLARVIEVIRVHGLADVSKYWQTSCQLGGRGGRISQWSAFTSLYWELGASHSFKINRSTEFGVELSSKFTVWAEVGMDVDVPQARLHLGALLGGQDKESRCAFDCNWVPNRLPSRSWTVKVKKGRSPTSEEAGIVEAWSVVTETEGIAED